jgi:hypothetical protein
MKKLLLIGIVLSGTTAWTIDQPQLKNAKVEQRSAATGLEQQVRSISGAAWIAYAAPSISGNHNMCCYSFRDSSNRDYCCGICGLEKHDSFVEGRNDNCPQPQQQKLEGRNEFFVFMRVAHGNVEKVRMFSPNCQIDAGGMNVVWLNEVKPAESVAFLSKIAEAGGTSGKDEEADGAIAALAMHVESSADEALAKLMTSGQSEHVAEQATFWAGTLRGSRGYEMIAAALETNGNSEFRKHAVFALSQNSDPRAQTKLIDLARHDNSSDIRGESLFWLSQAAGKKAAGVIASAIEDDPNTDVKKKAVFALSQLPEDEGIPLLISQAEKNANPVVRREAIFWLGQSGDKRALDYITSVLQR